MRFHKNCRDRGPQLGPEASGRLRYAARNHYGGQGGFCSDEVTLSPGEKDVLFERSGPGFLACLTARIPENSGGDLLIRIITDSELRLCMRLADFFLSGNGGREITSRFSGKRKGKDNSFFYYRNIFVPYRGNCRVELENTAGEKVWAALSVQYVNSGQAESYDRHGLLSGVWVKGRARTIGEEINIAEIRGRGALHSIQMTLENPMTRGEFLEGNIEMYIDGNPFPDFQSTGTEEFFMGGIYFTNLHNSEYSGCTRTFNDGKGNPKNTLSAFRLFIEDEITFEKSLKILWHNGQPRQGAVAGSTFYNFTSVFYLDDPERPAPAIEARTAAAMVSAIDGSRGELPLYSSVIELQKTESEKLEGSGTLETLSLHTENENRAEIAFDIDGRVTDYVPVY